MKNSTNHNLIVVYVLTTILLAFISISSYISIQNLIDNAGLVDHTNQVLLHLENFISEVKDAESGQRGYLLTHREEFLTPYLGSYNRASAILDSLKQLMVDSKSQLASLDSLEVLMDQRYVGLQAQLKATDTTVLRSNVENIDHAIQGRRTMLRLKSLIASMEKYERELLVSRNTDMRGSGNWVLSIITVFTITTFIILTLTFIRISSELKKNDVIKLALENSVLNLNRSNEELEQFAYVASHDLQEPLRKIRAFGDILSTEYKNQLGDNGKNYIERMENAAARMQVLISDLLNFSRVSRSAGDPVPVNMHVMWQQIFSDFETLIEEKNVKINYYIDQEVEVLGTRSLLGQLFQNLLSNAIKFSAKDGNNPEVTIAGRHLAVEEVNGKYYHENTENFYEFRVTDNGIGFEEKYLDRIFIIFQRLHSRTTYEGTGIGLALCRKIVENHGGSITAESKPNQGATFIVVLPIFKPVNVSNGD